jgi:hypothetical protein
MRSVSRSDCTKAITGHIIAHCGKLTPKDSHETLVACAGLVPQLHNLNPTGEAVPGVFPLSPQS